MIRHSWLLGSYRLATRLMEPLAPRLLARRQARGKEDAARIRERLGFPGRSRPEGRLIWMHGASVGEGVALLPLVSELVGRGCQVLVTTGTASSARLLADRLPPGSIHQFVPVDGATFFRRFLTHWRPELCLLAESELWPNMIVETHRGGVPIVLVNARMSPRSSRGWQWLRGFAGAMLGRIDLCLAQSVADADSFLSLGAPSVRIAGNLKYDAAAPRADHAQLGELAALIGDRPVWIAASTHEGEETVVADVHIGLASRLPRLLTILAPRHPQRGMVVATMLRQKGVEIAVRSIGERPGSQTMVYLVDTIGDLGTMYRLAGVAFLGKSLAGTGGQNPVEPAKLGCAILHGPNVQNFSEAYRLLGEANAAIEVANADDLCRALAGLLTDPARLRAMARAGSAAIERQSGAVHRTMQAIEPYLTAGARGVPS